MLETGDSHCLCVLSPSELGKSSAASACEHGLACCFCFSVLAGGSVVYKCVHVHLVQWRSLCSSLSPKANYAAYTYAACRSPYNLREMPSSTFLRSGWGSGRDEGSGLGM